MSLLNELKQIKIDLPETECFIPEWKRSITLRAFTVREGRKLREGEGDDESLAIKTLAHAIADGDKRPLANKDGVALLESLSQQTVRRLMGAFARISSLEEEEKNSEVTGNADSSSGLPSPSDAPLMN